jgi:hypothetical protein
MSDANGAHTGGDKPELRNELVKRGGKCGGVGKSLRSGGDRPQRGTRGARRSSRKRESAAFRLQKYRKFTGDGRTPHFTPGWPFLQPEGCAPSIAAISVEADRAQRGTGSARPSNGNHGSAAFRLQKYRKFTGDWRTPRFAPGWPFLQPEGCAPSC